MKDRTPPMERSVQTWASYTISIVRHPAICALLSTALAFHAARAADPTKINDSQDVYQRGSTGLGLPTWRVSEPFETLWIQAGLVRYGTSAGKTVGLDMGYRQRGASSNTNASSFGPNWQCGWLSTIVYSVERNEDNGVWYVLSVDDMSPPLGGSLAYVADATTPEYNTHSRLGHSGVNIQGTGFSVSYPDGTSYFYNTPRVSANCGGNECIGITNYLSSMKDPQGRQTTFNYTVTNNLVLLTSAVDYDGRSTLFFYDSTFPNRISAVVDPYLRTNSFKYVGNGRLTNTVNAANIASSFVYDSGGFITNIITPYGSNVFQ